MDRAVAPHGVERPPMLPVGTVVWLASELMFFGGLFAAYFALRAASPGPWPPADVELEVGVAAAFTALLVASSGTMEAAVRAVAAADTRAFRRRLALTAALAVVFLANQAREWAAADFAPDSHSYGSAFFVMTGFHGLHVLGGVLAMGLVAIRSTRPGFGPDDVPAVEVVSYYWHFVDAVWVVMFATLFLLR